MTWPEIELRSLGPLVNTLLIRPMARFDVFRHYYIYICYSNILWLYCAVLSSEKLDENYTRILLVVLNKSWKQHPTKQLLYANLPSISLIIQVRRIRHTGHGWRRKTNSKSTFSYGMRHASTCLCWPTRKDLFKYYIHLVRPLDAVWRTCQERWVIGKDHSRMREREGEREREWERTLFCQRSLMMVMMVKFWNNVVWLFDLF